MKDHIIKGCVYAACAAIIIYIGLAISILTTQYTSITVSGNSMEPTLSDGDKVFAKVYRSDSLLEDGDLISLTIPYYDEGMSSVIKRYVADLSSETEVYFLGDNLENSYDSSICGTMPISCIDYIIEENKAISYANIILLKDLGFLLSNPSEWF